MFNVDGFDRIFVTKVYTCFLYNIRKGKREGQKYISCWQKLKLQVLFSIINLKLLHLLVTLSSGQNKFGENRFYSNPWVLKSCRMFNTFKTFLSSLLLMRLVINNFFCWFRKVFPSKISFLSIPVSSGTFSQIYTNTASIQRRILNIS